MKILVLTLFALALTGCASPDYAQYAKTQQAIATSRGIAETARYRALADIAANGDGASKVAAVMALALGQGGAAQSQQIAAPAPNAALQWASVLVPAVTQVYSIRANADVAMRSSDNAMATGIATTAGFVGIAGQIQAPGAITTVSGNSGANSGDSTATPTVVTAPNPVVVPQPPPVIVNTPPPLVITQPAPIIVQPVP